MNDSKADQGPWIRRCLLPSAFFLVLALSLAACSTPSEDAPRRLIVANVHPEGYPTAAGLRVFERLVASDPVLGERVDLDLQLGGVLGNEKEVLEKVGFGAVQLYCGSVAPLAEFSATIGVLSLPYLFRDEEHMWAVLDGELGDELLASLGEAGFIGLAFYDAGARSFYNRDRPVQSLADLQGLKIRVQKSEMMRAMVEALGATPMAIGFKEVYTSLHTGAIDGAENNLPSYRSERHFEVARFLSLDRHSMIPDLLLVGGITWSGLDEASRAALRAAARRSSAEQRRLWAEEVDRAREAVVAAGTEIVEIEDPEAFRRAVEPLYRRYGADHGEWVERIRAVGAMPTD